MFFGVDGVECWRREFPGRPEQARELRRYLTRILADCRFLDDVLLGADELAVNTLRHTRSGLPGGRFTVGIRRWGCGEAQERVAITVEDQGGESEPAVRPADGYAESGRGLLTLSRTAHSWGWFGNAAGRTVCAVFAACPAAPAVRCDLAWTAAGRAVGA